MHPILQSRDCTRTKVESPAAVPLKYCHQGPAGGRSPAGLFKGSAADSAAHWFSRPKARWFLFFILLLAITVGLHLAITIGLRRVRNSSFGETNRLINGDINAQIVISGSSRALVHYDPRIIARSTGLTSYNIGRNGSQTDLQLAVIKTYLQHNAKPRLLVHNLDLYAAVTSREIYDPTQYVPYLGEDAIYQGVARIYSDAWKWKYIPLYGYIVPDTRLTWLSGLGRLVGIEPRQDHIDGFVPRDLAWTGAFDAFRKNHPHGFRTPVEPRGLQDLEEIILLCSEQRIPLVFVYSPEYFEIQPFESNRGIIFGIFRRLCTQYKVPFWDYSDSTISLHREYFYNSQHLNATGASLFSSDFGVRLKESGLVTSGQAITD